MSRDDEYANTLASSLTRIEAFDGINYPERNRYVYLALVSAIALRLDAGIRHDPREPDWPVVYIELPTGQVSWHVPQHTREWDGHTTAEKYNRCREYTASQGG